MVFASDNNSAGSGLDKVLIRLFAALLAGFLLFNFAMNMHASSGIPYWDDWQYFFGVSQGLSVPLSWESLLSKEADYVNPPMRLFGHAVWWVVGADFLVFRLLSWLTFAVMLAVYIRLLVKLAPGLGWAAVAGCLFLAGTVNIEYFYYQYMSISQPLYYICYFLFGIAMLERRYILAAVLLVIFGSFSIYASSYVLAAMAAAVAMLAAATVRRGPAALLDARVALVLPLGGGLVAGILYLTFAGSYANHTGQPLVLPWTADLWVYLFSSFAAAVGLPVSLPLRYLLPAGGMAFALLVVPPLVLAWRRCRGEPGESGSEARHRDDRVFVLMAILAGTVAIAMLTGMGRGHLCGADLAGARQCGGIPRYVFPVIIALPAAIVAAAMMAGGQSAGAGWRRQLTALALLGLVGAGYVLGGAGGGGADGAGIGKPSLARWNFAPFNRMMAERDAASRDCLVAYLADVLPRTADGIADWSRPLICPSLWTANDVAPFLHRAFEQNAPFLPPLLAAARLRQNRPSLADLLATAVLGEAEHGQEGQAQGGTFRVTLTPLPGGAAGGHVDQILRLNDGTLAAGGWAADFAAKTPARYIVAMVDGRVAAVGTTGSERPDVAAAFQLPGLDRSGFVVPLGAEAGVESTIRIFLVTDGLGYIELPGVPGPEARPPAKDSRVKDSRAKGSLIVPARTVTGYFDDRPTATYRLPAHDQGVVLRHGDAPGQADIYGARDPWVFADGDRWILHYDAAGPDGWLVGQAVSRDGVHFDKTGIVLPLGAGDAADSASASYGTTFHDGQTWRMFYLGTRNTTPPPERIPALPYVTLEAESTAAAGPWVKRAGHVPFSPQPGTYYADTASPGQIIRLNDGYGMVFSAAAAGPDGLARTLGLARTADLDGPWTVDPQPLLPPAEQIENASLYYQAETGQAETGQAETGQAEAGTWFLFTNHVGLRDGVEFTDAVWVYWSRDPTRWDPRNKAVVVDGSVAGWSRHVIGLPSVVRIGNRLAIYYDGLAAENAGSDPYSHMQRDIAVAWVDLPIQVPEVTAPSAVRPRLLDRLDAVADRLELPVAAARPDDGQCHIDRFNGKGPGEEPGPLTRALNLVGWTVVSAGAGTAPDRVVVALTGPQGERLFVDTRKQPRPDVKAHFGHPAMSDPGFAALADLRDRKLGGTWRMDLLRVYRGAVYPCGLDRPVVFASAP